MTDRSLTRVLALEPVRGSVESLEQVLALPDFTADLIVIVGDDRRFQEKRQTYRAIFGTLGHARRAVLWIPVPEERPFEPELRRAYEGERVRPSSPDPRGVLFAPRASSSTPEPFAHELLDELTATFMPRLAARVQRPAVYLVRGRGGTEWLEL